MAVVAIEGLKFHAPVGIYEAEQILGSDIEVSVKLVIPTPLEDVNGLLQNTVDYEQVCKSIGIEVMKPTRLLESLVQAVLLRLSREFPIATRIKVRVAKLNPPMPGRVYKVWVEDTWVRISKK